MKRNMELMNKILINVEKDEPEVAIEGYNEQEILYHKNLLVDEGLILGKPYFDRESEKRRIAAVLIQGLTPKGHDFIDNNGKKDYSKIEKTETNYNINIHGDNHGIASAGNENININSEFNQKFIQLTQAIENSNISNKDQTIKDLNDYKEDKVALQKYLGTLLTRGAEVATLVPAISALLGLG